MTDLPERIWIDWKAANAAYLAFDEAPLNPWSDAQNPYIRADLSPSPEVVKELVDRIGEARLLLDTGAIKMTETMDYPPATILHILNELDAVMAALAKLEGGE